MIEPVLVKYLSADIAGVTVDGVHSLWIKGKARKERRCCLCLRTIKKGALSWRTIGNELFRPERVCAVCW